jgi:hypothetical protein
MKKHFWLIAITTLGLFLVGFLIGPFVFQRTAQFIGKEVVGFTLSDFLVAPISLGLLLAFCSICAGCLLWAYSRNNFEYPPLAVFGLGLIVSLFSATVSIGFKLLQMRSILHLTGGSLDSISLSMGAINYFSLGYGVTLMVNIILIAILLWFSRQQQEYKDSHATVHND